VGVAVGLGVCLKLVCKAKIYFFFAHLSLWKPQALAEEETGEEETCNGFRTADRYACCVCLAWRGACVCARVCMHCCSVNVGDI
jgi:hypothetical protein